MSPPRRPHVFRPAPSTLATALLVVVAFASHGALAGPEPGDAGPALVLTNEHVGMNAEQIEAAQAVVVASVAPAEAPAPMASDADAEALEAAAEAARERARRAAEHAETTALAVAAAEAGVIPGIGSNRDGPARYETCVEALIRRGDSFGRSDRICRSIYGEAGASSR